MHHCTHQSYSGAGYTSPPLVLIYLTTCMVYSCPPKCGRRVYHEAGQRHELQSLNSKSVAEQSYRLPMNATSPESYFRSSFYARTLLTQLRASCRGTSYFVLWLFDSESILKRHPHGYKMGSYGSVPR